jgi:pimeloyl-ACP methyl ester carboxylesterase
MTSFVLIPGAGGAGSWYWQRVVAELSARGRRGIPVDLPAADESAGLSAYADLVVAACADEDDVVVVAQSMGGFTAALVTSRRPVAAVVLLNAMIPLPGETVGEWWDNVGATEARLAAAKAGGYPAEFDVDTYFLHDVPAELITEPDGGEESDAAWNEPCAFDGWPVPVTVVAGREDRFFPLELQQRLARDRVGVEAVVVPGGHLAALSRPAELTDALLAARPAGAARVPHDPTGHRRSG